MHFWENLTLTFDFDQRSRSSALGSFIYLFIYLFIQIGFKQLVNHPTHRCDNILDIVLTKSDTLIDEITIEKVKAAFHPCVNVYIYKPINRSE